LFCTNSKELQGADFYNNETYRKKEDDWPQRERLFLFERLISIGKLNLDRRDITVLDFGSGPQDILEKEQIFSNIDYYDPYVDDPKVSKTIPQRKYDLVICTEVLEHTVDPVGLMFQLVSLVKPEEGIILLTTLLHDLRFNLVYLNPLAGHIGIHSAASLNQTCLKHGYGLEIKTFNANSYYHMITQMPEEEKKKKTKVN
jgi:hypothetical protein